MLQMLEPTTVKLVNVQTRAQFHGEDQVLAIDLTVVWKTSNQALAGISKELRGALFCNLGSRAQGPQEEMDLPVDALPNVRLPGVKYPLNLDFQQVGARVEVAYGISEASAIVLQLCKLSKFKVTPIEGGSTEIRFLASSSADIDCLAIAPLLGLQQHEISMKLTMPDVEQEPEAPLTEADVFGDPPAAAEETTPANAGKAAKPGKVVRLGKKAAQAAAKSATEEFLGQHGSDAS